VEPSVEQPPSRDERAGLLQTRLVEAVCASVPPGWVFCAPPPLVASLRLHPLSAEAATLDATARRLVAEWLRMPGADALASKAAAPGGARWVAAVHVGGGLEASVVRCLRVMIGVVSMAEPDGSTVPV
jgi:hypothetical protein